MCFPQQEEALKQHKTLSQELVNLRGELGKSKRASGSSFSALGKVTALDKSALPSCSAAGAARWRLLSPSPVSVQTLTIDMAFESWQCDLKITEFLALVSE